MSLTTTLNTVKSNILNYLENENLTVNQMRDKMPGVARSTLYKAVTQLLTEGYIRRVSKVSGREEIYTLGSEHTSNTLIPNLRYNKYNLKSIHFLQPTQFEEAELQPLNKAIIGSLARIFAEAGRIEQGQSTEATLKNLKRIKANLKQAQEWLSNLHDLVGQINNETRFWDPELLARMVKDDEWSPESVITTLNYFEGTEGK